MTFDPKIPKYPGNRFQVPDTSKQVQSPYDQDSSLFQDLVARNVAGFTVVTLNLGTAGQLTLPMEGYHFVFYGHDGSTNKAVDTTILVNAWINTLANPGSNPFPAKHARGFSGPFGSLYLEWPAQLNSGQPRYADLVIFKSIERPWIDGETPT